MASSTKRGVQPTFILMLLLFALTQCMTTTGVGTLLTTIQADLAVSETIMGTLVSIPLIAFAVSGLAATLLARRLGLGRVILGALCLVLAGGLLRSYTNAAGLFAGTAVMACGIGLINVLGLALVKLRAAPEQVGSVTGTYSTIMSLSGAIAIALCVPIANAVGWRNSLAFTVAPTVLAAVAWAVQHHRPENQLPPASAGARSGLKRLLRSPLAWQVTIFVALQHIFFFCINGWFPTILQSRGFSPEQAALAATMLQVLTLPTIFLTPLLFARISARAVMGCACGVTAVGLALFILAPNQPCHYAALVIIAVGWGSIFSMNNLVCPLRTRNADDTAALSGMSQFVGYLLASVGPVTMGSLFEFSGSWLPPLLFMFAVLIALTVFVQLSARERYLFDG